MSCLVVNSQKMVITILTKPGRSIFYNSFIFFTGWNYKGLLYQFLYSNLYLKTVFMDQDCTNTVSFVSHFTRQMTLVSTYMIMVYVIFFFFN